MGKHFVRHGLIMDGIRAAAGETRKGKTTHIFYDYVNKEIFTGGKDLIEDCENMYVCSVDHALTMEQISVRIKMFMDRKNKLTE